MAMDLDPAGQSDYVLFRMHPIRMPIEDADQLRQKIEDMINLELGRDAVRVESRVRVYWRDDAS